MKILITSPSLSLHDAVSQDVFLQAQTLREQGHVVGVYAELNYKIHPDDLISWDDALNFLGDPQALLIYHHSVYWFKAESFLPQARCKKILRYHNITPTKWFEGYDLGAVVATKEGKRQTEEFIKTRIFEWFLGASAFNNAELIDLGAAQTNVIVLAPMHKTHEMSNCQINLDLSHSIVKDRFNVLFVGRFVPHKGHLHLLRVLDLYLRKFGDGVQFHFVGKVEQMFPAYRKELETFLNENRLWSWVKFHESASLEELHTLYSCSQVFMIMSEHEGFCVPILEAQAHKLPIVALDQTAIGETLGPEQLKNHKIDYEWFASALHHLRCSPLSRIYLAEQGSQNYSRFQIDILKMTLGEVIRVPFF